MVEITKAVRNQRRLRLAGWMLGGTAAFIVILAMTLSLLLKSQGFHKYILAKLQAEATASLGVPVHLRDFDVDLWALTTNLFGVTVEGSAPYSNPALLEVGHARVEIRILSLWKARWSLESIEIDHPIVRIFVDSKGHSNLPVFKSSSGSKSTSAFDLAIHHAVMTQGDFYYNDRETPVAADLHDLQLRSTFDSMLDEYSVQTSYSEGHLQYGSAETIAHSFSSNFKATPTELKLTEANLTVGQSKLKVSGLLKDYSHPVFEGQYDSSVDGTQIGAMFKSAAIPHGSLHTQGNLKYVYNANQSVIDALTVSGTLDSKVLEIRSGQFRAPVAGLLAKYILANGTLEVSELKANSLGGAVTGSATFEHLSADPRTKMSVQVDHASLAALRRASGVNTLPDMGIEGSLNATLSESGGVTLASMAVRADATILGQMTRIKNAASNGTAGTPLRAGVHGSYSGNDGLIQLDSALLEMNQTSFSAHGQLGKHSSVVFNFNAGDLSETTNLAELFLPTDASDSLRKVGLTGAASFDGTMTGSNNAPQINGTLQVNDFSVRGTKWHLLKTRIEATPSVLKLENTELNGADRGRVTLDAQVGMTAWSITKASALQANVRATEVSLPLLQQLSGESLPITGTLNARADLHGTVGNPSGVGKISLANVMIEDQPVQSAELNFSGNGDSVQTDLAFKVAGGAVLAKATIRPNLRTYTAQFNVTGLELDQLRELEAKGIDAVGEVSIDARGQGSFDNPQLTASARIPQLTLQDQKMSGIELNGSLSDHWAHATLNSAVLNTSIQAKATVQISADYPADISLDTATIPLAPLLALYAPDESDGVSGQTEMHATLHGPLRNSKQVEAHVTIPKLQVGYGDNISLAAASPIHVDMKDGLVVLQPSSVKGTDTDLEIRGSLATEGSRALSLGLHGTVNLQLAQLFDEDLRTSGSLKLDINSSGTASSPHLGGKVEIVDAGFASPDLPVGLERANGVLTLSDDRLSISNFQGYMGGGTLTAQGSVALRPKTQFDVGLTARGVRMIYPQGLRESVGASVRLTGGLESALLSGSVNLSDLSFTSAFDPGDLVNRFSGGVVPTPVQGFSQNLKLNLALRSTNDLNLVSRTLSLNGSANLQVRGTAANPVLLGRVNLNSGDVILNGDRFVLDGGTVEFVNPSETQPVLNLSLKTTIQQYDVYLRFNGPVDQLKTNYSSDPALPSADIINLLAFGQTTEANSANPATPTNQAAASLVASQVSSEVTSRVSKIAGISQLSINPVLASGSSQGPAGANITVQQRVTGNLFVTFSTNVASTQSQTIQGQYQLTPRVAISATRDPNGGFAFDALIKKSW